MAVDSVVGYAKRMVPGPALAISMPSLIVSARNRILFLGRFWFRLGLERHWWTGTLLILACWMRYWSSTWKRGRYSGRVSEWMHPNRRYAIVCDCQCQIHGCVFSRNIRAKWNFAKGHTLRFAPARELVCGVQGFHPVAADKETARPATAFYAYRRDTRNAGFLFE